MTCPRTRRQLELAWARLYDNPETRGTQQEETAFRALTMYDVAHLEGPVHRSPPLNRPEARS